MPVKKLKLNQGCINLFKFLMLLYEDKAYYQDVVEIYKNDIDEKNNNTIQVILNKAINALKVFGIKISKRKNQYFLDSSLYSLNYNLDDLKSICFLIEASENFPDAKAKANITEFVKNLELRMDNDAKSKRSTLCTNIDFSFFYKNLREQIDHCKQLCQSNMTFDITYLQNGKEISTKGTARDVTFDTKNAYLQMLDIPSNTCIEVPTMNILRLVEHPTKAKNQGAETTITFKVTGGLSKRYKLKENETLLEIDKDGNKIIINKGEPINKLLARLMRYTDCCYILSPKSIKQQMQNLINETLTQYSNED